MANQKKSIEIDIDEEGNVTIEAHGYIDGSCRTATAPFENALGAVSDRQMKDNRRTDKERAKVTS